MRLGADEARRRFTAVPVARLATVGPAGQPHIVPVTFAVDGDLVYTAVDAKPKQTTRLQRLRNILANPHVALLADHYDADWDRLWWVRADGLATIAEHTAGVTGLPALLAARYPQYRERPPAGPVIRVAVRRWTGGAAAGR
ncbi:MAG: TIGR03668 family PPOX class F420-dependent oxidoreductase [Actinobacteria bacterium]|nr:TIGR03668 family PPOX class F420-dependent oxidoreductase [Actinomycetota bacterium]